MNNQHKRRIIRNGKPKNSLQSYTETAPAIAKGEKSNVKEEKPNAGVIFKAFDVCDCPHYKENDEFGISGYAIYLPFKKGNKFSTNIDVQFPNEGTPCKTLLADITKTLVQYERANLITGQVISCGSCQGKLSLKFKQGDESIPVDVHKQSREEISRNSVILQHASIFETLNQKSYQKFVQLFQRKQYAPGDRIIKHGEPNENLYIVLSGLVDVFGESKERIAELQNGEVFGEMSLVRWHAATANVCAAVPTEVLCINAQDLLKPLENYPSLRIYLAKLISRRLSHSKNIDFIKGLTQAYGKIEDIGTLTLVKSLHYGEQTGVLSLYLPKGSGRLIFRDGKLVGAEYGHIKGKAAFIAMLGEEKGKYEFKPGLSGDQTLLPEIGMFEDLLLEGLQSLMSEKPESIQVGTSDVAEIEADKQDQPMDCAPSAA